jgi:hypothetical protein
MGLGSRRLADYAAGSEPVFRLPHPYLIPYYVVVRDGSSSVHYQLSVRDQQIGSSGAVVPRHLLTSSSVSFSEPEDLKSSDRPSDGNNTAWARARRSPLVSVVWEAQASGDALLAQSWLVAYTIFTIRPTGEYFRLTLEGPGSDSLASQLKAVALAVDHPKQQSKDSNAVSGDGELLVLRGNFWQGAGSPFGPRPVWLPEDQPSFSPSSYPLAPLDFTMTIDPPTALVWHPRRPVKPRPGSVIYSRWIPHLGETFSMVALDWEDKDHLNLFHQWQNDPRVSQGWNETGTLEQHREYLRRAHDDPHQITVLARFDDICFAYFEIYWAKVRDNMSRMMPASYLKHTNTNRQEDRLGAYYSASDFDRGRHSLVGDVRYRGPHRVTAWWSSLMHYLFLDDPRTMWVVGEPKHTNGSVLMYDLIHGFGLDKLVDLPHKRSAFVRCSRERFFQLCPLDESEKIMGGTTVGLLPKL